MAIGVAGFTGIISVFRRRSGGEDALSAWRVSTILTTSFGALLFATLPMGLALLGLPEPLLWRVASAFYLVATGLILIDVIRRRSQLPAASKEVVRASRRYPIGLYALAAPAIAAQLLNLHPSLLPNPAGVYFLATLAMIAGSCAIFVRTLFGPHHDN